MINKIQKVINRAIYSNKSFSQEGEDIILSRLFNDKKNGFYVDVGAHHPFRFSNTFKFYEKGWCGINIEPNPEDFHLFSKYRKRDININAGVGSNDGTLTYYMFNEPALNTFCSDEASKKDQLDNYSIVKKIQIPVFKLENLLQKYLPQDKDINFLSIDIEGFEWEVFSSGFLDKYKPQVIVVEILNSSLDTLQSNKLYKLLLDNNYSCFSKLYNSLILTSDNFSEF